MRVGELVALKWTDIDTKAGEISITKTCYNPNNNTVKYKLLPPKTKKSKRIIDVAPIVITELERYKNYQNTIRMKYRNIYYDKDFVFTNMVKYLGYPELIKNIKNRMTRFLKLSGLNTALTPHSLRHTHTSLLAEARAGLQEIMERLGHADDKVTRNIYLHITKSMKKEASHKFAQLMENL